GPVARLAAELRGVARRRTDKVDEGRYRGPFRELAFSLNAALRAVRPSPQEISDQAGQPAPYAPPLSTPLSGPLQAPSDAAPLPPLTTPSLPPARLFSGSPAPIPEAPVPGSPFARVSHDSPHSSGATLPAFPDEGEPAG